MSVGDTTSSENFLQHADHFVRIIKDKNKDQNKANVINKPIVDDKQPTENSDIEQESAIKNKE